MPATIAPSRNYDEILCRIIERDCDNVPSLDTARLQVRRNQRCTHRQCDTKFAPAQCGVTVAVNDSLPELLQLPGAFRAGGNSTAFDRANHRYRQNRICRTDKRELIVRLGLDPVFGTAKEFAAWLRDSEDDWKALVELSGMAKPAQ